MSNQFLSGCGTSRTLQELICKYIVLENYFMSESLSKVSGACPKWVGSTYNQGVVMVTGCADVSVVSFFPDFFNG